MPRPTKERKVCCMPKSCSFGPLQEPDASGFASCKKACESICMTIDEYETIRLIDLDGYTQEDCAEQMNVARSTVQLIYNEARRKLADALVNGKQLKIQGGNYRLCDGGDCCPGSRCKRRRCTATPEILPPNPSERNMTNE